MKYAFVVSAIAIVVLLFLVVGRSEPRAENGELDAFARCLTARGAVMYGADWCPHCQNEKRAFGASFRFINYVECPKEPQRCLSVGIKGYPTWIFPDGKKLEGEQGVRRLAEAGGCQLPD